MGRNYLGVVSDVNNGLLCPCYLVGDRLDSLLSQGSLDVLGMVDLSLDLGYLMLDLGDEGSLLSNAL